MACFAALVAAIVIVGGCGKDPEKGSVVDRKITNTKAYQLNIGYLQQTVNGLSWNAVLSEQLPGKRNSPLYPTPVPCAMDDDDPEQPYQWGRSMWLLRPEEKTSEAVLQEMTDDWIGYGWNVKDSEAGRLEAKTTDQFTLVALLSNSNEVSVTVSSPCFPKSQLDRNLVWPETITKEDVT